MRQSIFVGIMVLGFLTVTTTPGHAYSDRGNDCSRCHSNIPDRPPENSPPVAVINLDQQAFTGNTINLDGSGSYDSDGDLLTFQWSLGSVPVGSSAALSDPTLEKLTFFADVSGDYLVHLIVNDGTQNSAVDSVRLGVTLADESPAAEPPVPDEGVTQEDTGNPIGFNEEDVLVRDSDEDVLVQDDDDDVFEQDDDEDVFEQDDDGDRVTQRRGRFSLENDEINSDRSWNRRSNFRKQYERKYSRNRDSGNRDWRNRDSRNRDWRNRDSRNRVSRNRDWRRQRQQTDD